VQGRAWTANDIYSVKRQIALLRGFISNQEMNCSLRGHRARRRASGSLRDFQPRPPLLPKGTFFVALSSYGHVQPAILYNHPSLQLRLR
jgi:hypothetical protein